MLPEAAAFSSPRSQFFAIWTDPKPQITYVFFSCDKLAYKMVSTQLELTGRTRRLRTIVKNLTSERASNSDTKQRKMY